MSFYIVIQVTEVAVEEEEALTTSVVVAAAVVVVAVVTVAEMAAVVGEALAVMEEGMVAVMVAATVASAVTVTTTETMVTDAGAVGDSGKIVVGENSLNSENPHQVSPLLIAVYTDLHSSLPLSIFRKEHVEIALSCLFHTVWLGRCFAFLYIQVMYLT